MKPFGRQLQVIWNVLFTRPRSPSECSSPLPQGSSKERKRKWRWTWKSHIDKKGNWGLKSANNHCMWMCPLKHSFGCYPDAPTNGLFHWSSSRNANLLNASQLREKHGSIPFIREGGSFWHTLSSCNEQGLHIYVFAREHLKHKRG